MNKHLEYLKALRASLRFNRGAYVDDCAQAIDGMIAVEAMDAGSQEKKDIVKIWDDLRVAALNNYRYTYPANAESVAGVKGDTVDARAEASKIYLTRINNYLRPQVSAMEFFTVVKLADDEIPYYQNETNFDVRIAVIDQDGGYRSGGIVKRQSQQQIPLSMLSSERVKFKLWDLLRGKVADENIKLIDIAQDLALSLDGRLWTLLQAGSVLQGTLTVTGAKEKRVYNAHPSIYTANLPSTNVLSATSAGGVNKAVLDLLFQYAAQWGGVFPEGDLYPTTIYYPSLVALSILGDVTVTTQPNQLHDQIITRGFIHNYLGREIVYRPLVTLNPANKKAYAKFNRPIGTLYLKPGMDRLIKKEDEEENEGSMQAKSPYGAVIPAQNNPFICSVQYAA